MNSASREAPVGSGVRCDAPRGKSSSKGAVGELFSSERGSGPSTSKLWRTRVPPMREQDSSRRKRAPEPKHGCPGAVTTCRRLNTREKAPVLSHSSFLWGRCTDARTTATARSPSAPTRDGDRRPGCRAGAVPLPHLGGARRPGGRRTRREVLRRGTPHLLRVVAPLSPSQLSTASTRWSPSGSDSMPSLVKIERR